MLRYIKADIADVDDEDDATCNEIAENETTRPSTLEKLSKHDNWVIRMNVAKNLNTPVKCLCYLAGDRIPEVKGCVAANPNTPVKVLMDIQNDALHRFRLGVSSPTSIGAIVVGLVTNPNTPLSLLIPIIDAIFDNIADFGHYEKYIWAAIAQHPNVPDNIRKQAKNGFEKFDNLLTQIQVDFDSHELDEGRTIYDVGDIISDILTSEGYTVYRDDYDIASDNYREELRINHDLPDIYFVCTNLILNDYDSRKIQRRIRNGLVTIGLHHINYDDYTEASDS